MKNRPLPGSSPRRTGRAVLSDGSDGAIGYRMGRTGRCLIGQGDALSDESDGSDERGGDDLSDGADESDEQDGATIPLRELWIPTGIPAS